MFYCFLLCVIHRGVCEYVKEVCVLQESWVTQTRTPGNQSKLYRSGQRATTSVLKIAVVVVCACLLFQILRISYFSFYLFTFPFISFDLLGYFTTACLKCLTYLPKTNFISRFLLLFLPIHPIACFSTWLFSHFLLFSCLSRCCFPVHLDLRYRFQPVRLV